MQNTVTFETALKLKEAGFSQPEPKAGQLWYIGDEIAFCYWNETNGRFCLFNDGLNIDFILVKDAVFAPTATDILRELSIGIYPDILRVDISAFDSSYDSTQEPKYLIYSFGHNLSEAAAIAWLKINSKK